MLWTRSLGNAVRHLRDGFKLDLKDDKVTSVLIGASKPEQILDNIKIIGHTDFTEEELQKIETIVQD